MSFSRMGIFNMVQVLFLCKLIHISLNKNLSRTFGKLYNDIFYGLKSHLG